jgi:hypothetical protein
MISMFEDSLQIAMDEGWFGMASLVAIAGCNHQMYALVDRADHLWEPFLADIKFPQTGLIDDTDWKSPDIPLDDDSFSDLRLPPRINGGRRDGSSFFVHPRDKEARGCGLVLANCESWPRESMFNQTTGILVDLFHDENEVHDDGHGIPANRCIYIPRALPIECKACRVMLDSYPALVSHCKQWSHRQNMDERGTHADQRVPEEFVDPRYMPSYEQLSVFGKVRALKTFEHKFIAFLHAPLDQDGIANFRYIQQYVLERMVDDPYLDDVEDMLPTITLQRVWEAFIEFVLVDFYDYGIDRYSLNVILADGWRSFDFYGSGSCHHYYNIITGTD